MITPIEIKPETPHEEISLRKQKMSLDAGWLGQCFGSGQNAPMNIAGFVVVLLVGAGIVVTFAPSVAMTAREYWQVIVPLVTLVMGYVFGQGSRD